jgi:hypothetical protein
MRPHRSGHFLRGIAITTSNEKRSDTRKNGPHEWPGADLVFGDKDEIMLRGECQDINPGNMV